MNDAEFLKRIEFRIWAGAIGVNIFAASFYFPTATFGAPWLIPDYPVGRLLLASVGLAVPYIGGLAAVARYVHVPKRIRPIVRWVVEDREPTEDERMALAALPRRMANLTMTYWLGIVLVIFPTALLILDLPMDAAGIFKTELAFTFNMSIAWVLTYLLVERVTGPLFAMAMAGAPSSEPRRMGVTRRLLLAWGVSAGYPFLLVMIIFIGLDARERNLAVPFVFMACGASIIAGVVAMLIASRTITDPLEKVRVGLQAIEQGEYDIEIPVDEASEIGVLQMGFNRMVHGLRERERMRHLFGQHVGTDVAQRAMDTDFKLGGELHVVTAMFVDVIGSTGIAQRWTPDEVVAALNDFFDRVVRCVQAEGGFVNKFEGDGALCIFGAPVEQHDHSARALRAARALRRELMPLSETLDAAIGLSSGEVVAGNVGAASRYEYTVIGDPVNEASRLTEEAKSRVARTLASDSTLRLAGDEALSWSMGGSIALRGRAEPTIAYEPKP